MLTLGNPLLPFLVAFAAAASLDSDQNIIAELSEFDGIDDAYIEKLNSAQDSWTAGHNFPPGAKFVDLKTLSGTILREAPVIKDIEIPDNLQIPRFFDARQQWPYCESIRKIKNQGQCGACWAVSSATVMSDRLCISSEGEFNSDISAQNIASCTVGYGCHGGWPYAAWQHFVEKGFPTGGDFNSNEGCQPYLVEPCINRTGPNGQPQQCGRPHYVETPTCKNDCYNSEYETAFSEDLHFAKSVYVVRNTVEQIQAEILKNGPVVASFSVYCDFYAYKTGVYEHKTSRRCNSHAVRIIGWGEENGKDYWLITNQWGEEWGEQGLVKFLRGTNECGIEKTVVAGLTGTI